MIWTIFEYLYRDASNFKAFGCIALEGRTSAADREMIRTKLDSGEYFVAEQIGVPPLYEQLYEWSNGPTSSDHCWHEFVAFREGESVPAECECGGSAAEFIRRFTSVTDWDISRSPHFGLV